MNRQAFIGIGVALLVLGAAVVVFGLRSNDTALTTGGVVVEDMTELAAETTPATFPAIQDSAVRDVDDRIEPRSGTITVVATIDHDTQAFTQGLEFDGARLYESTGLVGSSTLRELDPVTGATLRSIDVDDVFAEGLTIVDGEIIQLTWQAGEAYRYDVETFELLQTHTYDGEGWGLCDSGDVLYMSDGTPTLTTRDGATFEALRTVEVTFNGAPVERINELECVGNSVWANIWQTPLIIEIDPTTGVVMTVLDATELRPESTTGNSGAVLNGIAFDASTETFLLSGKLWPVTYRVQIG